MMMRSILAIALMFGVTAAVAAQTQKDSAANQSDELTEDYKIYDAVLSRMFAGNKITFDFGGDVPVKLLVIEERTAADPFAKEPRFGASLIRQEAVVDYEMKSDHPVSLQRRFKLNVDYVLVNSPESRRAAHEREGKDNEVHGVVRLSRVGFNKARTKAYLYMDYVCGDLCGHGWGIFLVRSGETWTVDNVVAKWIS